MKLLRSLAVTFSLYSALPMPMVEWNEESMEYVFSILPFVGLAEGAGLALLLTLSQKLALSPLLTAAAATALPVLFTGGIHLDGFCDTCDALGSHQSRERMLEIMKDPHIGAFGVMGCALYLLTLFAAWASLPLDRKTILLAALIPVLSRSWVALAALTQPNARGSGLLAKFTDQASQGKNRVLVVLELLILHAILAAFGPIGCGIALSAVSVWLWSLFRARRSFGGLTGDLAGWLLCLMELWQVVFLCVIWGRI